MSSTAGGTSSASGSSFDYRSAALSAALDQIAAPTFVLSPQGHIEELNALGRAVLARDRAATLCSLQRATTRHSSPGRRTALAGGGWLVVLELDVGTEGRKRVQRLAARAALTRQQARVLDALAAGLSNRGIAATLRVSTRTVESHLQAIYDKLGVGSRVAVLAELLAVQA